MTAASPAGRRSTTWASNAHDWAGIQEQLGRPLFWRVFADTGVGHGTRLLDAGCGGGVAATIAGHMGAAVTGVDAVPELIEIARMRMPDGTFVVGDLEALPVADHAFDVVTAFSSISLAADPAAGIRELARAARPGGTVAASVPDPEDSDAADFVTTVLDAAGEPAGAHHGGLADRARLRSLFTEAGLDPGDAFEVDVPWTYRDTATLLRAMAAVEPVASAAAAIGPEAVERIARSTLQRFRVDDGSYRMRAAFTVVIGTA